MNELIAANRVVLGQYNAKTESWTINYWVKATGAKKPKTVWWETRYDAGTHGTSLVNTFLGSRRAFSFPKSVYAVSDCLAMVVRDRPNARILDFFAGSGTTLHSTLLLNQQYGGSRQCVLGTNNELNYKAVAKLNKADRFRGDLEYEAQGVFESATRPRVKAALSGKKPNGEDVKGKYLDGRKFAEGFAENVEFFELDYLDGAEVEFGLLGWSSSDGRRRRRPGRLVHATAHGPWHRPPLRVTAVQRQRRDLRQERRVMGPDRAAIHEQRTPGLVPPSRPVPLGELTTCELASLRAARTSAEPVHATSTLVGGPDTSVQDGPEASTYGVAVADGDAIAAAISAARRFYARCAHGSSAPWRW